MANRTIVLDESVPAANGSFSIMINLSSGNDKSTETSNLKIAYAHSLPGRPQSKWQPLDDHLNQVAETAARFAACFDSTDWAWNAGQLHGLERQVGSH
jgi:hypothetical protein